MHEMHEKQQGYLYGQPDWLSSLLKLPDKLAMEVF